MGSRAASISSLMLAIALPAAAKTLTADGLMLEASHGYRFLTERDGLVEDGSFEAGTCQDGSIDYVELFTVTGIPQTPILPASVSTIKSRY